MALAEQLPQIEVGCEARAVVRGRRRELGSATVSGPCVLGSAPSHIGTWHRARARA